MAVASAESFKGIKNHKVRLSIVVHVSMHHFSGFTVFFSLFSFCTFPNMLFDQGGFVNLRKYE